MPNSSADAIFDMGFRIAMESQRQKREDARRKQDLQNNVVLGGLTHGLEQLGQVDDLPGAKAAVIALNKESNARFGVEVFPATLAESYYRHLKQSGDFKRYVQDVTTDFREELNKIWSTPGFEGDPAAQRKLSKLLVDFREKISGSDVAREQPSLVPDALSELDRVYADVRGLVADGQEYTKEANDAIRESAQNALRRKEQIFKNASGLLADLRERVAEETREIYDDLYASAQEQVGLNYGVTQAVREVGGERDAVVRYGINRDMRFFVDGQELRHADEGNRAAWEMAMMGHYYDAMELYVAHNMTRVAEQVQQMKEGAIRDAQSQENLFAELYGGTGDAQYPDISEILRVQLGMSATIPQEQMAQDLDDAALGVVGQFMSLARTGAMDPDFNADFSQWARDNSPELEAFLGEKIPGSTASYNDVLFQQSVTGEMVLDPMGVATLRALLSNDPDADRIASLDGYAGRYPLEEVVGEVPADVPIEQVQSAIDSAPDPSREDYEVLWDESKGDWYEVGGRDGGDGDFPHLYGPAPFEPPDAWGAPAGTVFNEGTGEWEVPPPVLHPNPLPIEAQRDAKIAYMDSQGEIDRVTQALMEAHSYPEEEARKLAETRTRGENRVAILDSGSMDPGLWDPIFLIAGPTANVGRWAAVGAARGAMAAGAGLPARWGWKLLNENLKRVGGAVAAGRSAVSSVASKGAVHGAGERAGYNLAAYGRKVVEKPLTLPVDVLKAPFRVIGGVARGGHATMKAPFTITAAATRAVVRAPETQTLVKAATTVSNSIREEIGRNVIWVPNWASAPAGAIKTRVHDILKGMMKIDKKWGRFTTDVSRRAAGKPTVKKARRISAANRKAAKKAAEENAAREVAQNKKHLQEVAERAANERAARKAAREAAARKAAEKAAEKAAREKAKEAAARKAAEAEASAMGPPSPAMVRDPTGYRAELNETLIRGLMRSKDRWVSGPRPTGLSSEAKKYIVNRHPKDRVEIVKILHAEYKSGRITWKHLQAARRWLKLKYPDMKLPVVKQKGA